MLAGRVSTALSAMRERRFGEEGIASSLSFSFFSLLSFIMTTPLSDFNSFCCFSAATVNERSADYRRRRDHERIQNYASVPAFGRQVH